MRKTLFCLIFSFIILSTIVFAQGNVILTLKNINTNEIIDETVIYLDIDEEELIKYVESGESLEMSLDDGVYNLVLQVDDPSTPGKDFFKKQSITVVNGGLVEDVYLFPVCSVRGIVKDVFDNVVSNAELSFECTDDSGVDFPLRANKYGSFTVDYMPSCSCKISANLGDAVGFREITFSHGNITDVEILLDKTILTIPNYTREGFIVLLVIIVLVLIGFRYRKKIFGIKQTQHHVKHEENKEQTTKDNSRADDIKATLNKKEKDIVEFLSGKGEVGQASIRHNLGIPRTSLSRVLASLEHKKIIHVKKVGKVVKIKLTDWFLGKE